MAEQTRAFTSQEPHLDARQVLRDVARALAEKGYRPVDQIVGYLVTGDPAYITSHRNARLLIRRLERDAVLEEMVDGFLSEPGNKPRAGRSRRTGAGVV